MPRPSPRLIALLAVAAVPAALAGISRRLWWLTLLIDLALLAAFALDFKIADPKSLIRVRCRGPKRILRRRPFSLSLELENPTKASVAVEARLRLPESFEPREYLVQLSAGPQNRASTSVEVRAMRRGQYVIAAPVASRASPLKLMVLPVRAEPLGELGVLPDLSTLGQFDALIRQRRLNEMGIAKARQRGEGTEIDGLRPYAVGDAYSAIDWKATARRAVPVTREMHAERRQSLLLLLDCGRRMSREVQGRSRLDYAVEAALLLGHVALRSDDRVGLFAFTDRMISTVPTGRGPSHAHALAQAMFALEPALREPPYRRLAAEVIRRFPRRSLAILFTDVVEPSSLRTLIGPLGYLTKHHLVLCVVFQDSDIQSALQLPLNSDRALFQVGAASELSLEREHGLAGLRRAGALVLESAAGKLSTEVVNRYLEVKARQLL